jgi:hypothetical protein
MRQADEAKERRLRARGAPRNDTIRPYTWHPNKEQREALREQTYDIARVLIGLEFWIGLGHRITLGKSANGDGVYCVIRDGSREWQDAQAVFVYHSELGKALQGLNYYLVEVAPEFPSVPKIARAEEEDW